MPDGDWALLPGVRRTCGDHRGEGGRAIYSKFLGTLMSTFRSSFTEPKTPSQETKRSWVLSVSSSLLFFSWHFLNYSYILNVDQSLSQLCTSLFPHLSQQTFFLARDNCESATCESQQRATQSSCNFVEHNKISGISLNIYEFTSIKATGKNC